VSYAVVLTKADQVKPGALAETAAGVAKGIVRRAAAFPDILTTSSRTGAGLAELRAAIVRTLAERGG
jgi:GTP-binding protein